MKHKKIAWTDGTILHAELLNRAEESTTDWISKLLSCDKTFGVLNLLYDKIFLDKGVISINKLELIFPDLSYIDYASGGNHKKMNGDFDDARGKVYEISLDLKKEEKLGRFYIEKTQEKQFYTEAFLTSTGDFAEIEYEVPKMRLTANPGPVCIPIFDISEVGGVYVVECCSPFYFLKKDQPIFVLLEELYLSVLKTQGILRDKIALGEAGDFFSNLVFLSSLSRVGGLISFCLQNEVKYMEIYKNLYDSLCTLSWKMPEMPMIPAFNSIDQLGILKNVIGNLYGIVDRRFDGYKLGDVEFTEGMYIANIGFASEILIVADPSNENVKRWLDKSQIFSMNFKEDILSKRIPGASRKMLSIFQNSVVISIDLSRYIDSSPLCVFGAFDVEIKGLRIYYKP